MKVIGFTVLFGALFSKTYRVYVIFRNARFKSKVRVEYFFQNIECSCVFRSVATSNISAIVYPFFRSDAFNAKEDVMIFSPVVFLQHNVECT